MAEFIPGSASGSLSQMRMQPLPMMSPEQAAAYRTIMLQANVTPTESPVTANFEGAYSTGPRGSQLMLNPSVSAKLGDALTVGGGYRTGPMGGVHGRAEIKLPAGLRALLEGSKARQSAAVAAPVAGGELSATLARMAGQGNMPAQMQGRVGYRIPFANGGGANAEELPPEQDESLIDMATRYGQGVMRKHPVITRGLVSAATDPLDLMQFLAMHGVDPEIVAPNQIETPEQVASRHELASSIPNAGELAQKYLAQAGVRESETLPEQLGEAGISMLGPAMLAKAPKAFSWGAAKAPKAFSWGAKILGKTSPAKAPALTTDAFHGTSYDFPAFVNNPGKVARGEKDGPFVLDQALGTHFAKDPNVSNTFTMNRAGEVLEDGRIIPARIPDERTFLEAKQDLLPYMDRSTPRGPSTVYSDQDTIQKMIAAEGYKLRPDLLARYLVEARKLPEDVADSIAKRLAKGKSVSKKEFDISIGPPKETSEKSPWKTNKEKKVNLEQFLNNYGGNPYNSKDRADLVDTARKSWQDKGYTGLKYLNTSPRETEFAKDPTSYIVFDPKHTRSRFAKFNPADVESSDLVKASGGAVRMGKGGLLKAGAEELTELAAKYLPKAEKVIPHGDPQREANLARYMEGSKAPPVLYHGTPNWKGTAYNPNQTPTNRVSNVAGFYADTNPETANGYALDVNKIAEMVTKRKRGENLDPNEMGYGPSSQVLPVHMAIKNPFVPGNSLITKPMLDTYAAELKATNSHLSDYSFENWAASKIKDFAERKRVSVNALNGDGMAYQRVLKAGGYDGLKDGTAYVAFEPTQIKSAVGNLGTFDPTTPDFGKATGGAVHMGKGGLLKAGAEELTELAAKYLPKAEDAVKEAEDYLIPAQSIKSHSMPEFESSIKRESKNIENVPISWLSKLPGNAFRHSDEKINEMAKSIAENGLSNPLIISVGKNSRTAKLGEGNHRLEALKRAGFTHAPVKVDVGGKWGSELGERANYDVDLIPKVDEYFPSNAKPSEVFKSLKGITKSTGGAVRKASGGLSRVNEAGNYTKPGMRKRLFNSIKARAVQGTGAGQWSARKAQLLAKSYKEKGGGYKD